MPAVGYAAVRADAAAARLRQRGCVRDAAMLYSTPIGVAASGKAGGMREGIHGTGTARPADDIARRATDAGAQDSAGLAPGPEPGTWGERLVEWTALHPRALLAAALLLALAARIFLVARSHAMLDGDEALVGIQAESILRGARPFYFYAQPYMGSLEAYLAAALFRVFGPSAWALRAVPLLLALPLVYLTWQLAREILPARARTTPLLAGLAALFAAAPPLYDAVAELRTWGGQIEIYMVTLALLLSTVELTRRMREGAGRFELARRWALLGALAGLGIWINPLVTYALAACALWLLAHAYLWYRGRQGQWQQQMPSRARLTGAFVAALALVAGLAVGGLPAWIYALQHSAENLLVYVTPPQVSPAVSGAAAHGRLFLGAAITARYVSCVAPRVLDGGLPEEPLLELPLRLALLLPPLAGIAGALWLVWQREGRLMRVQLPLLYAGVVTAVFCLGTAAWGATKPCERDYAGRYAVPLALVEPLLLLALFAAASFIVRRARGERAGHMTQRAWTMVLLVVLAGGIAQVGSYALAAPRTLFHSPYFRRAGLEQAALTDYLRQHGIRYAWANHWVGNVVTFETDGATTCADYYDAVHGGLRRPPGVLEAVSAAERPSFILALTDPHPLLAQELDAQGIPYTLTVLRGAGVIVITPARTVDPATVVDGLAQDYPY